MLLQLSHFFLHIILLCPAPPPSSIPPLLHVHRLYISILWLVHFLYYSKPPPVYFVPTIYASYCMHHSLLFIPFPSPTENHPCDLHFCDSVLVLVVCFFSFSSFFRFSFDSCEFIVILLFILLIFFLLNKSL